MTSLSKEKIMTYKTYRYWHFSDLGHACICAACEVDKETRKAKIGFSFCSPAEKGFNKRMARRIAEGRLALEKSSVEVQLPEGEGLATALNGVVFDEALEAYIAKRGSVAGGGQKGQVPRWVHRALCLADDCPF
jgi:hypothetical protein